MVSETEKINQMRENLVQGVQGPVTLQTFKAVCAPVGQTAKKVAKDKGWAFKQTSLKYRNPKHAPDSLEKSVLKQFGKNKDQMSLWVQANGQQHYFRRIIVKKQCLACHGSKNQRPQFIQSKYPKDKAFGFNVGDLRGLYHVTF